MKWADFVNLSTITQIESNFPNVFGRPTTKSIAILSHIHLGMGILWSVPPGLWYSYFTCWQFGNWATKSTMSRFILLYQKCCFRSQVLLMFFLALRVYQYVINEYNDKEIQIWLKNPVHQAHESSRGIRNPKRHYKELIMPISSPKSSLGHIRCPYFQLMITGSQVNLREDTSTL